MGQIQNAVLGMIGTAGVASYALQRTPAFQKHKEYKNLQKQDKIISEAIANPETQEQAERLNDVSAVIDGKTWKRIETISYPGKSLREIILNAFCHTDYFIRSNIKIEFFKDEIV